MKRPRTERRVKTRNWSRSNPVSSVCEFSKVLLKFWPDPLCIYPDRPYPFY